MAALDRPALVDYRNNGKKPKPTFSAAEMQRRQDAIRGWMSKALRSLARGRSRTRSALSTHSGPESTRPGWRKSAGMVVQKCLKKCEQSLSGSRLSSA